MCHAAAAGFYIVVCGLDSILARRWLNGMLVSLLGYHDNGQVDQATIVPMVDGGTEGNSFILIYLTSHPLHLTTHPSLTPHFSPLTYTSPLTPHLSALTYTSLLTPRHPPRTEPGPGP